MGLGKNIGHVQPVVFQIFSDKFGLGFRIVIIFHNLDACLKKGGARSLEALIQDFLILLKPLSRLLQSVIVVFLRAERNVRFEAKVLSFGHLDVFLHLVDADECW